jgi:hypothetical protein
VPGEKRRRSGRGGLTREGREFAQLVVDYAKQETLGPLKGLGRYVALGAVGSVALSAGGILLVLAGLRALQTETGTTFEGNLSWLPYVITAAAAMGVIGLAVWRITKGPAARSAPNRARGRG